MDWWHLSNQKEPSEAKIAWKGNNTLVERNNEGTEIQLFEVAWTNPHPERSIATIDVVSSVSGCDPYLVAVTVEREK